MRKIGISKGLIALLLLASLGACVDDNQPKQEEDIKKEIEKDKPNEGDKNKDEEGKDEDKPAEEDKNKDKEGKDEDKPAEGDKNKDKEGKDGDKPAEDDKNKDKEGKDGDKPAEDDKNKDEEGKDEDKPAKDDKNKDKEGKDKDKPAEDDKKDKEGKDEDKPTEEDKPMQGFAKPAKRSPVFLLEFTGQLCRYCPETSRLLKKKEEKYGRDRYLYVALHSEKKFSKLPKGNVSLYNEEADQYGKDVKKPKGLPQHQYNSLAIKVPDLLFDEMLEEPDLLEAQGEAKLVNKSKIKLNLSTRLRSDRVAFAKDKKIDILVWILENDIVAYQDDNGKYTWPKHQRIFRSSLNGHWGQSYEIGTSYRREFDIPKNVAKAENCEIIVLFLDNERMVLDADHFKLH